MILSVKLENPYSTRSLKYLIETFQEMYPYGIVPRYIVMIRSQ